MVTLTRDTVLGQRYRLSGRIAVGGMGEVWRAEDTVLHRTVAVKVLKRELAGDPQFLERFRAEARTTAALSHPGIANVFDYGEARLSGGSPSTAGGAGRSDTAGGAGRSDTAGGAGRSDIAYLVMEHVDGEPLAAILARQGRLPSPTTLDLLGQAGAALQEAHRVGLVHRDIKPANLLIRPDGVVKVTDFGIARVADAVPLTMAGMVVGTAQYFSPEQAAGDPVTPASDVYSLGVVGYECLAGRLPFLADTAVAVALMQIRDIPPPLPADVPGPVRALLARTLAKDPRLRYPNGGALAAAARAAATASPGPVPRLSHPAGPPAHRPRWPLRLGLIAVLMLLGAAGAAVLSSSGSTAGSGSTGRDAGGSSPAAPANRMSPAAPANRMSPAAPADRKPPARSANTPTPLITLHPSNLGNKQPGRSEQSGRAATMKKDD